MRDDDDGEDHSRAKISQSVSPFDRLSIEQDLIKIGLNGCDHHTRCVALRCCSNSVQRRDGHRTHGLWTGVEDRRQP